MRTGTTSWTPKGRAGRSARRNRTMRRMAGMTLCVLGLCAGAVGAEESRIETKPRVGVYDSRAIAVAFVGSPVYAATEGKKLAERMAEHTKAKAEGNQKRVAELEAWGRAQQVLLHKQVFSTASVDDILKHIQDRMPDIAKAAGVGPIVSKWDRETLTQYPSAEWVDVTMALVDAFNPNDRQRTRAIEIQKHAPISLEQAEKIQD